MELGNMIFGNSRGVWPVPRTADYEQPLYMLTEVLNDVHGNEDWRFGDGFESKVFDYRAYWWGDCECGYEEKEHEWSESNEHSEACYRTAVERNMDFYASKIGYSPDTGLRFSVSVPGSGSGHAKATFEKRSEVAAQRSKMYQNKRERVREALCDKMGLSYPQGSAVHCTCDYMDRWDEFSESNSHSPDCPPVRPNFKHHPSELELRWYKYPLRDSYMSREVGPEEWAKICMECVKSLGVAVE